MRKKIVFIIAVLAGAALVYHASNVISARKNVIWLAEPDYYFTGSFSEGLAVVNEGELWGYINRKGEMAIEPQYDYAADFSEGLAAVRIGDKCGYINRKNEFVINPAPYWGHEFSEGMALISIVFGQETRFGYINSRGRVVVEPQYGYSIDFSEGLAAVSKNDMYGYINREGKVLIPFQFEVAYWFSEGLAAVLKGEKWGYINRKGETVIDFKFDEAEEFYEGVAMVSIGGGAFYINRSGGTVSMPESHFIITKCSEGLYSFNYFKWAGLVWRDGYLDPDQKVMIDFQFDSAGDFSEGYALACNDRICGFIKNPLTGEEQQRILSRAGLFIGSVVSAKNGELVLNGSNASRVKVYDRICLFSGDEIVIIRITGVMNGFARFEMVAGEAGDVKPGRKVYKYIRVRYRPR